MKSKIAKPKREHPTPVRFPDEVKKKLSAQAKKENRSLGNMIVTIVKEYYGILAILFFLSCDKEDAIITPPPQTPLCQIISWTDTMFTGALRHNVFTYNEHGNPVQVISEHAGTGAEPDYFTYDSLQRLIEHASLFTFQYLYHGSDTLPYGATEIWPYGETFILAFTYDDQQRIVKVMRDSSEVNYTYDSKGNLVNDQILSSNYSDKPSIYSTNKWWPLIHLNFSKNSLSVDNDYNECDLPQKIHHPIFLRLEAGTVEYVKK